MATRKAGGTGVWRATNAIPPRMRLLLLITAILTVTCLAASRQQAATSQIQSAALKDPMPVDPQITVGTFANGLRYYVRANNSPEKRAELRLVIKAGSILEDDDQQGLAHFVEHMAFNGTKHFPKNEVVSFRVPGNALRCGLECLHEF